MRPLAADAPRVAVALSQENKRKHVNERTHTNHVILTTVAQLAEELTLLNSQSKSPAMPHATHLSAICWAELKTADADINTGGVGGP